MARIAPEASCCAAAVIASPSSCRDRGWMGGWVGALCLSLVRVFVKPTNRTRTRDRHKAPASSPHHPLSLQDGERRVERWPNSVVNIHQGRVPRYAFFLLTPPHTLHSRPLSSLAPHFLASSPVGR